MKHLDSKQRKTIGGASIAAAPTETVDVSSLTPQEELVCHSVGISYEKPGGIIYSERHTFAKPVAFRAAQQAFWDGQHGRMLDEAGATIASTSQLETKAQTFADLGLSHDRT